MYYTYVLQSELDRKFYIGVTNDLKRRINEHTNGLVNSTKVRRPFKLVYYEACLGEWDAIKREKYFKTGFGRKFLVNRLENSLIFKKATPATQAEALRGVAGGAR